MAESKDAVALELLDRIAMAEGKVDKSDWLNAERSRNAASKDWILDTYIECLKAAHGQADWRG